MEKGHIFIFIFKLALGFDVLCCIGSSQSPHGLIFVFLVAELHFSFYYGQCVFCSVQRLFNHLYFDDSDALQRLLFQKNSKAFLDGKMKRILIKCQLVAAVML